MWKHKASKPSHSQETETLLAGGPVLSAEGSSISSELGNLSLGPRISESVTSEEVFSPAESPTKERVESGSMAGGGREGKKGGNGERKHVMIEVQPGGDFKKPTNKKKNKKHGHDRSSVSFICYLPLTPNPNSKPKPKIRTPNPNPKSYPQP